MKAFTRNFLFGLLLAALVAVLAWFLLENRKVKRQHQAVQKELVAANLKIRNTTKSRDSLIALLEHPDPGYERIQRTRENPGVDSDAGSQFINQSDYASIPSERFFTTTRIEGLEPGPKTTRFRVGQEVYLYAGIHAPQEETVQIKWFGPDNKVILPSIYKDVLRNTGPTGYRIFTYKVFRVPGDYKVRLINSSGKQIGETRFTLSD